MPAIHTNQIHIQWEGPFSYEQLKTLNGSTDYGVYQIYGCHPVYGSGVLLYIGKAAQQTFSTRLDQEWWGVCNRDSGNIQVYVGRLSGTDIPNPKKQGDLDKWDKLIDLTEKLLIFAHHPASNSSNLNSFPKDAKLMHIFNWGQFRSLMAEISGMRWTSYFDDERESWMPFSM